MEGQHRRSTESGRRVVAALSGLALCAGGLLLFLAMGRAALESATRWPGDPASVLTLVACAAGGLLTAWTGLGVLGCALSGAPGTIGALARRLAGWSPPLARRVAAILLGTSLSATLGPLAGTAAVADKTPAVQTPFVATALPAPGFVAGAAVAARDTPAPLPDPAFSTGPAVAPAASTAAGLPAPGWAPTRPPRERRRPAGLDVLSPGRHPGRMPVLEHVVVRRGDSLWRIAARHLGPGASAAEVAREWPRWHAANRDVIGDDPAVLVPGQQLEPPSPNRGSS